MELARLWKLVFAALDDHGDPGRSVDLVWMPAHTKQTDVGVALLSNGIPLTDRDRQANDAADHLAKRGAQTHRVPVAVRKAAKQHELLAIWASRTLAIATHASNNLIISGREGTHRDATGLPAWRRKKCKLGELVPEAPPAAAPPAADDTLSDAHPPADGAVVAAGPRAPEASQRGNSSSDSDSSEVDLDALDRRNTARLQKARRRKVSRERTIDIARRNCCFAVPDANEATAPHRQRHLADRVRRRAALLASGDSASARAQRSLLRSPPRVFADEQQGVPPALVSCASAPELIGSSSAGVIARPTRAARASLATERRATSAALSSLLS